VTVAQGGVSISKTINIRIVHEVPVITLPPNPWSNGNGYVVSILMGGAVDLALAASNNPTSWDATGLPYGLTLDNAGEITGSPQAGGTATITASNNAGASAPVTIQFQVVAPPQNAVPWLHDDPDIIDLVMDYRTGEVTSYYAASNTGLTLKAGDDVFFAVVIKDALLAQWLTALNDLCLVIAPANDFESSYVEIRGVELVQVPGGFYFALSQTLDEENCPRLQEDFNILNKAQGPNAAARTLPAMLELRIKTADDRHRRSKLFPVTFEQNASF